jgi:putative glycerol-1-phosphate prenyltransferase
MNLYEYICSPGKKFTLLIDPDKLKIPALIATVLAANEAGVKLIFIGGSLMNVKIDPYIEIIKKNTDIPVILFPGSLLQLSSKVDAMLLLSLVSGRNSDYLIGNHVIAAQYIKHSNLEVIPTGYILIEGGTVTSVEYISNTKPIPAAKTDLIVSTAIASEMLGHKLIYLEAGSGAINHVPLEAIREVKRNVSLPLIVGGGINTPEKVKQVLSAGADMIVVGNAIEKNAGILHSLCSASALL